jgi:hypothetical protein
MTGLAAGERSTVRLPVDLMRRILVNPDANTRW